MRTTTPASKSQLTTPFLHKLLSLLLNPLLDRPKRQVPLPETASTLIGIIVNLVALVERVSKGNDLPVLVHVNINVSIHNLQSINHLTEVHMRHSIMLGGIGVLDDVVGRGEALFDKVCGGLCGVGGGSSKQGGKGCERGGGRGGGAVLLMGKVGTEGLDVGAMGGDRGCGGQGDGCNKRENLYG